MPKVSSQNTKHLLLLFEGLYQLLLSTNCLSKQMASSIESSITTFIYVIRMELVKFSQSQMLVLPLLLLLLSFIFFVSTLRYGDISPTTKKGRLAAILWILFGIAACSLFVAVVSSVLTAACLSQEANIRDSEVTLTLLR